MSNSFAMYANRLPVLLKALLSSPSYSIQNGLPDGILIEARQISGQGFVFMA